MEIWYGGTFDPVHNGHLAIARAAAEAFDATVTLAPAADPPHRPRPGAEARQRAQMLELAVAGDARLRVDRRELQRAGPSWTVDTLRELRGQRGPDAPLALLLGADSFQSLPGWREWRALPGLVHFIVAARAGPGSDASLPDPPAVAAEFAGRWRQAPEDLASAACGLAWRLRQPLRGESATAVRQAIAADAPGWRAWLPAPVAAFIDAEGLYRA